MKSSDKIESKGNEEKSGGAAACAKKRKGGSLWVKLCVGSLLFCVLCVAAVAVLQHFSVIPADSSGDMTGQLTEEAYEQYVAFDGSLLDIETEYLNDKGFVDDENVEPLLDAVEAQTKSGVENGTVSSYSREETGISITYSSGIQTIFMPYQEGMLGGNGGGKIYTLEPNADDYSVFQESVVAWIDGNYNELPCRSYSVSNSAKMVYRSNPDGFVYQRSFLSHKIADEATGLSTKATGFLNDQITVEKMKQLSDGKVIIWEGHGAYDTEHHSCLVTGEAFIGWEQCSKYKEEMEEGTIVLTSFPKIGASDSADPNAKQTEIPYSPVRYYCITSKFVDKYMGQFDQAPIVFLGSCFSGKDDVLANSFLNKGAAAVICYSDETSMEYEMLTRTMFFYALSQDPNTTVSDALTYARNTIGSKDTQGKHNAEMICFSKNIAAYSIGLRGKIEKEEESVSQPDIKAAIMKAAGFTWDWFYESKEVNPDDAVSGEFEGSACQYYAVTAENIASKQDLETLTRTYYTSSAAQALMAYKGFLEQDGKLYVSETLGLGGIAPDALYVDVQQKNDKSYQITLYEHYDYMSDYSEMEGKVISCQLEDKNWVFDTPLSFLGAEPPIYDYSEIPSAETSTEPQETTAQGGGEEALGEEALHQAFLSAATGNELYFLYRDYDQDGRPEAYGIAGDQNPQDGSCTNVEVFFLASDGAAACVTPTEPFYGYLCTGDLLQAGNDFYLVWECSAAGSGSVSYIWGVKDGKSYMPGLSGNCMNFCLQDDGTDFCVTESDWSNGYHDYITKNYVYDENQKEFIPSDPA